MNKPKFKIGDVVRLKSGGPNMTILSFWEEEAVLSDEKDRLKVTIESPSYVCRWFTKAGKLEDLRFDEETLELTPVTS